jgi:uncharacterized protein YndB with AHSA1/START domain
MLPAATSPLTLEHASYARRAGASATGNVPPARVFATVCTIGGDAGWFFADYLWWPRRALDWLVGGPSFRRRRRHPTELRLGDVVDSWRVIGLEPDRRLTLSMEMKAPGTGVLEFIVTPTADGGSSVSATAYWQPAGVAGWVYWYVLVPAHLFIFDGLTRAIQRRAAAGS